MLAVGILILLHAAYSQLGRMQISASTRIDRKDAEARRATHEINTVPLDVLVELVLGLGISLFSGISAFGIFKNVKAAAHINKTPQTEFDFTRKFRSGKPTLAAALNECLAPELVDIAAARQNPSLAKFIPEAAQ